MAIAYNIYICGINAICLQAERVKVVETRKASINIEQHKAFRPGFEKFDKYAHEAKPEDFDGKTARDH